jgi:dynein heavy chain
MRQTLEYELNKFDTNGFWKDEFIDKCKSFLFQNNQDRLFVWVEEINKQSVLCYDDNQMRETSKELGIESFMYFIKHSGRIVKYTRENVESHISYGVLNMDDNMKSLLSSMNHSILPEFLKDRDWPENIKKDLLDQTHKFLAHLTETVSLREGKTKLYIPQENFDPNMSSNDKKDMIHRLEAILLHWTKQIKDLLNNQINQGDSDNAGPLEEISEWSYRKENLTNIKEQLENPKLINILNILRDANSSYLKSLTDLIAQIREGAEEAEDNLKFLSSLYEPCKEMVSVSPVEIPKLLPKILNCVRLIKEHSKCYNSFDRISGLLRKISNEIIKRCKAHITLDDMLGGNVHKCIRDLNDSIGCGKLGERFTRRQCTQSKRTEAAGRIRWSLSSLRSTPSLLDVWT